MLSLNVVHYYLYILFVRFITGGRLGPVLVCDPPKPPPPPPGFER